MDKECLEIKKIIPEEKEMEIVRSIIECVRENGLTISNLYCIMDQVEEYMKNNAAL